MLTGAHVQRGGQSSARALGLLGVAAWLSTSPAPNLVPRTEPRGEHIPEGTAARSHGVTEGGTLWAVGPLPAPGGPAARVSPAPSPSSWVLPAPRLVASRLTETGSSKASWGGPHVAAKLSGGCGATRSPVRVGGSKASCVHGRCRLIPSGGRICGLRGRARVMITDPPVRRPGSCGWAGGRHPCLTGLPGIGPGASPPAGAQRRWPPPTACGKRGLEEPREPVSPGAVCPASRALSAQWTGRGACTQVQGRTALDWVPPLPLLDCVPGAGHLTLLGPSFLSGTHGGHPPGQSAQRERRTNRGRKAHTHACLRRARLPCALTRPPGSHARVPWTQRHHWASAHSWGLSVRAGGSPG